MAQEPAGEHANADDPPRCLWCRAYIGNLSPEDQRQLANAEVPVHFGIQCREDLQQGCSRCTRNLCARATCGLCTKCRFSKGRTSTLLPEMFNDGDCEEACEEGGAYFGDPDYGSCYVSCCMPFCIRPTGSLFGDRAGECAHYTCMYLGGCCCANVKRPQRPVVVVSKAEELNKIARMGRRHNSCLLAAPEQEEMTTLLPSAPGALLDVETTAREDSGQPPLLLPDAAGQNKRRFVDQPKWAALLYIPYVGNDYADRQLMPGADPRPTLPGADPDADARGEPKPPRVRPMPHYCNSENTIFQVALRKRTLRRFVPQLESEKAVCVDRPHGDLCDLHSVRGPAEAIIEFEGTPELVEYLRSGRSCGWQPLRNVKLISERVPNTVQLPTHLWGALGGARNLYEPESPSDDADGVIIDLPDTTNFEAMPPTGLPRCRLGSYSPYNLTQGFVFAQFRSDPDAGSHRRSSCRIPGRPVNVFMSYVFNSRTRHHDAVLGKRILYRDHRAYIPSDIDRNCCSKCRQFERETEQWKKRGPHKIEHVDQAGEDASFVSGAVLLNTFEFEVRYRISAPLSAFVPETVDSLLHQRFPKFDTEPIRRQLLSLLSEPRALILPNITGNADHSEKDSLRAFEDHDGWGKGVARLFQFADLFGADVVDFRDQNGEALPLAMRRVTLRHKLEDAKNFPQNSKTTILDISTWSDLVPNHGEKPGRKGSCRKLPIENKLLGEYIFNGGLVIAMAGSSVLRPTAISDVFPFCKWRVFDWRADTTSGPRGYKMKDPLKDSDPHPLLPSIVTEDAVDGGDPVTDEFFPGYIFDHEDQLFCFPGSRFFLSFSHLSALSFSCAL